MIPKEENGNMAKNNFVSKNKMQQKAQKEINNRQRGSWGNVRPTTTVMKSIKDYDRKNERIEAQKLVNEVLSEENDFQTSTKSESLKLNYDTEFILEQIRENTDLLIKILSTYDAERLDEISNDNIIAFAVENNIVSSERNTFNDEIDER